MSPKRGINLAGRSQRVSRAVIGAKRLRQLQEQRARWKRENAEAIAQYNDWIAKNGIFTDR